MSIDNPFFHRGAIRRAEEFHGRQNEISQILGLCRNGQSVSIIGPRRIGKSSLMLHLCRPSTRADFGLPPSSIIFALVDCQELGGSPPEEVYESLLASIIDGANEIGLNIDSSERPGTYRSLDSILDKIQEMGISVVILLDEFELLAANERLTPYFFARLRGLTTKYELAYLTASQRPLFAITADEQILSSPFFNIFVTMSLGLFSIEESKDLIKSRLKNTGINFSKALNEYLLSFVGYHPCYLHIGAYHAFQQLALGESLGNGHAFSHLDAPIEVEANSHLSYVWQNLSNEEKHALTILDGPIEIMRQLEQQCLIQPTNEGYSHTSEILKRFVRRQQVEGLIQAGPFVVDLQRHIVTAEGLELGLTSSQFDLFVRLGIHAGNVVPSEKLEIAVWGDALVDDPDRLKTLIKRLRRAIEPYSNWIVSERGVGYSLRMPDP